MTSLPSAVNFKSSDIDLATIFMPKIIIIRASNGNVILPSTSVLGCFYVCINDTSSDINGGSTPSWSNGGFINGNGGQSYTTLHHFSFNMPIPTAEMNGINLRIFNAKNVNFSAGLNS